MLHSFGTWPFATTCATAPRAKMFMSRPCITNGDVPYVQIPVNMPIQLRDSSESASSRTPTIWPALLQPPEYCYPASLEYGRVERQQVGCSRFVCGHHGSRRLVDVSAGFADRPVKQLPLGVQRNRENSTGELEIVCPSTIRWGWLIENEPVHTYARKYAVRAVEACPISIALCGVCWYRQVPTNLYV